MVVEMHRNRKSIKTVSAALDSLCDNASPHATHARAPSLRLRSFEIVFR
jgi:hypothetical protein